MNSKSFFLLAFTLFFLYSCNEDEKYVDERTSVKFSFSVAGEEVDPTTRAIGNSWSANDEVGIFMKKAGADLSSENVIDGNENIKYVTPSGNKYFVSADGAKELYFPKGQPVDFIAYYPYRDVIDGYIYKVDVSDQRSPEDIDLLYSNNATDLSGITSMVGMSFSHRLAKLKFKIITNENISSLEGLTVTLSGLPTKADFSLATGQLTIAQSSAQDIVANTQISGATAVSEAIILPVTEDASITVTFNLPGRKSFKHVFPKSIRFEAGGNYEYDVELKGTGGSVQPNYGWFETPVKKPIDNTVFVSHMLPEREGRNYSMLYDTKYKLAYWVAYPLHAYYLGNSGRTDEWQYDPAINSEFQPYLFSSFGITNTDRGHQIPSADRTKSRVENATTFYYSNMTAQHSTLNQQMWANLENKIRTWTTKCDTMYVVTGAMVTTSTDKTIEYVKDNNGNNVARPKYYFKALTQKVGTDYYTIAYKMNNEKPSSNNYNLYQLTVKELEEDTGFTFFPSVNEEAKGVIVANKWQ